MAGPGDPLPHLATAGGYGRRYRHGPGHYFLNGTIALVAFALSCLTLHLLLPFPEMEEVTAKLRYFTEHKDEFDTIFIGSSRIYRQVIPKTFDDVASQHGVSTKSFNLAAGGMHPPESFYLLEQALRTRPAKLKWVFIEFEELYPKWSEQKRHTRRFLYWHTWRLTWLTMAKTVNPDGERRWWQMLLQGLRSNVAQVHLSTLLKNLANVGGARDWLDRARAARQDGWKQKLDEQRGYEAYTRSMEAEEVPEYQARLQRGAAELQRVIDPASDKGFRDCARRLRGCGATLVCVVPPITHQRHLQFRAVAPPPAPVLAFNDPRKYPVLYDTALRVDVQHLTGEGAKMFTDLLSTRFVAEVAAPQ